MLSANPRTRWLSLAALLAGAALMLVPASGLAHRAVRRSQAQAAVSRRAVPVRLPARRVARLLPPAKAKAWPRAASPMRTQLGRVWTDVSKHPEKLVLAAMP